MKYNQQILKNYILIKEYKIYMNLKLIFKFTQLQKSIFLKPNKLHDSEKLFCKKINQIINGSLVIPTVNSLKILYNFCNNADRILKQKDFDKIHTNLLESFQKNAGFSERNEKIEKIKENLDIISEIISKLPENLWLNTPDISNLFLLIMTQNLDNICKDFNEIINREIFSSNQQNIINSMLKILSNLLGKKIFIKSYTNYCNNELFSNEKLILMLPNTISKIKTAIMSFQQENRDFNSLYKILQKNFDLILKNSEILSIIDFLEFLIKIDKNSVFFNEILLFLKKSLKEMNFFEIIHYLQFLLTLEDSSEVDNSFTLLRSHINICIASNSLSNDEMKLFFNMLKTHKSNKKAKLFQMNLYKNFVENKELMTSENIENFFQIMKFESIDKNFIEYLQMEYIPLYMKNENYKNIEFHWILTVLRKAFSFRSLHMPLLSDIERYFIDNYDKIKENKDFLTNLTFLLSLLSINGFDESSLFKRLEDSFMIFQNNCNEKVYKNLLYTLNISVNATSHEFSVGFYNKLFEKLQNNNILEKFSIKETTSFFRSIAILWVHQAEKKNNDFELILCNMLNFILNSNIFNKIQIKTKKITEKEIILNNFEGTNLFLEDLTKTYQFLLTFKELLITNKQKDVWEYYSNLVDNTNLKKYAILHNSHLQVDVIEILKHEKIVFSLEKQIKIYFIDIFIEPNIVIEVLGDKHFSRDKKLAKRKDQLKAYHLKKLGYVYIEIPYFEFKGAFFTDFKHRKNYVLDKIKEYIPNNKKL